MQYVETISREDTYLSKDSKIYRGASRLILDYISDKRRYRKIENTSGISRASISGIIRRVFYAVTAFGGSKLIRLPTAEEQIQELTDRYLDALGFPVYRRN